MFLACLLAAMCGVTGAGAADTQEGVQSMEYITYKEHGAVGDGVADDFGAIVAAHDAANAAGLPVKADPGATYYIGPGHKTAEIQTDTDWGDAKFIIDDAIVGVADRGYNIFRVTSKLAAVPVPGVTTLRKNQAKLDWPLGQAAVVVAADNTTLRYIRKGANQNDGTAQTDMFIVDEAGNIDARAPIVWDYDNISSITAYPMDAKTLTVRGGAFTTIANQAPSEYTYYGRGIQVSRSNVVVDGLSHAVTGELDYGAPYGGFISISGCANVTVQNCLLSGHKTYRTIGSAGTEVSMGTYDINVNSAANVTFLHCKQLNDMMDTSLWGIMGSNFCKNLVYDGCELSRFDAHMGTVNATVKNSVVRMVSVTGFGVFLLENTKVTGSNTFISLRPDYGSFWDGEIAIRGCEFVTAGSNPALISADNDGTHDFGYPCMMPQKVTIDGLVIDDRDRPFFNLGPYILRYINPNFGWRNPYPYAKTELVTLKNVTVKSGRCLFKSQYWYAFMLWCVKVKRV